MINFCLHTVTTRKSLYMALVKFNSISKLVVAAGQSFFIYLYVYTRNRKLSVRKGRGPTESQTNPSKHSSCFWWLSALPSFLSVLEIAEVRRRRLYMTDQSMERRESVQGGQLTYPVDRKESTQGSLPEESESNRLCTSIEKKQRNPQHTLDFWTHRAHIQHVLLGGHPKWEKPETRSRLQTEFKGI